MRNGLKSLNTARPVYTAHPKQTVYNARPITRLSKPALSTVKRPIQQKTALTNKYLNQKVNTARGHFNTARRKVVNTARPKAVNTARPTPAVVNTVRENVVNAVKTSAYWGHPQNNDQGYVDSGCSRHMTGNMSYLFYFKEFDGGYVTFGGGAKGGRITGKGTLKTDKLDFKDVYFVKELKFNLLSVSHMCDKKNSVLFTDIGCFVLSPDFHLTDESQSSHARIIELQQSGRLTVKKLKQHVKNHWIMAGTGSPQFITACSATTSASGVICVASTAIHLFFIIYIITNGYVVDWKSDYKWSITAILIIQFIGNLLGTIAPLCRFYAALTFKLSIQ
ncbi:hypothetical protein Tco_0514897 [Tanacetum coccineum]